MVWSARQLPHPGWLYVGPVQVYDALDTILPSVTDGTSTSTFIASSKQQELKDPQKIIETFSNLKYPNTDDLAAWTLDKWKNNHIVEKTWDKKPDMDWYFHVNSLAAWLRTLDPLKDELMGNVALINNKRFAHGESGILLSNAATPNFAVTHNRTAEKWDPQIPYECCGDWVLAQILDEYEMPVADAPPTLLHGEALGSITFETDF